ncbi:MAG: hypothetical protein A3I01_01085 [Betaproteobacteria bacterium RIFCSPLOWO2_02_FULL_65_24]|nr:MAG: hypothetical protein A3I01_01085 [Betaproteobacteria bacterium RIFCSPLOWO2_02_FULL_65_24]
MNIANHVERTAPGRKAMVFEGQDISYGALDAPVPARVAFVREPPKSAAGKILKRVLRQQ